MLINKQPTPYDSKANLVINDYIGKDYGNYRMNILVANDDGIQARGIAELAKALSKAGNVYVAAPNSQRSASSHALSVNDEITMKKIDFEGATMAFEVGGTPADCVKLALYVLRDKGIDIDVVYAGINHGGNLGTDTMYSGTVSAAAEGLFNGLPAVAGICQRPSSLSF